MIKLGFESLFLRNLNSTEQPEPEYYNKFRLYLKRQKENAKGEVPVYMRVTVNGLRAEITIQRMIRPKEWDQTKGRSTSRSVTANQLNDYLQQNWLGRKLHGLPFRSTGCVTPICNRFSSRNIKRKTLP